MKPTYSISLNDVMTAYVFDHVGRLGGLDRPRKPRGKFYAEQRRIPWRVIRQGKPSVVMTRLDRVLKAMVLSLREKAPATRFDLDQPYEVFSPPEDPGVKIVTLSVREVSNWKKPKTPRP